MEFYGSNVLQGSTGNMFSSSTGDNMSDSCGNNTTNMIQDSNDRQLDILLQSNFDINQGDLGVKLMAQDNGHLTSEANAPAPPPLLQRISDAVVGAIDSMNVVFSPSVENQGQTMGKSVQKQTGKGKRTPRHKKGKKSPTPPPSSNSSFLSGDAQV